MNQEVIQKAQELAQLILQSEEFISMRAAEDAATQDEVMTKAFAEYEEKHGELENLTMQETPDYDKMGALTRELDEMQTSFNALPMAQMLSSARKGFTDMMGQVNQELQNVLQPEHTHEEGCSGQCGSCGGCHH